MGGTARSRVKDKAMQVSGCPGISHCHCGQPVKVSPALAAPRCIPHPCLPTPVPLSGCPSGPLFPVAPPSHLCPVLRWLTPALPSQTSSTIRATRSIPRGGAQRGPKLRPWVIPEFCRTDKTPALTLPMMGTDSRQHHGHPHRPKAQLQTGTGSLYRPSQ